MMTHSFVLFMYAETMTLELHTLENSIELMGVDPGEGQIGIAVQPSCPQAAKRVAEAAAAGIAASMGFDWISCI